MTLLNITMLISFAFFLGLGQILLKAGVTVTHAQARADSASSSILNFGIQLVQTWQFWSAMLLTGSLVLFWAWILTTIPLSKAYPFVVLAFVFAAVMEYFFFGIPLSYKYFIGCAFIAAGLIFILNG